MCDQHVGMSVVPHAIPPPMRNMKFISTLHFPFGGHHTHVEFPPPALEALEEEMKGTQKGGKLVSEKKKRNEIIPWP